MTAPADHDAGSGAPGPATGARGAAPAPAETAFGPVERLVLDAGSWVDVGRGWLPGAQEAYEALAANVAWSQGRLWRYEIAYDEPRLVGWWRPGDPLPHPAVVEAHRHLQHAYGVRFDGVGIAWYRDGEDSVAFHRDRDMRWLDDTVIAVLTLGARRPWQLRPRSNRYAHHLADHGATHDFAPGAGDLIVMGGATQAGWEHAVPKVRPAAAVGGRISLQWRWTSKRGRPQEGASYRSARTFSR
jgi:alkylated DNA repair dioxygenase AlkB